eukprot:11731889-Heterocapsa_arctica.AAC.1
MCHRYVSPAWLSAEQQGDSSSIELSRSRSSERLAAVTVLYAGTSPFTTSTPALLAMSRVLRA